VTTLRRWLYNLLFYGVSVPIVLGAPIATLFGRVTIQRYAVLWMRLQRALVGILGIRNNIEGDGVVGYPVLYASKHQSMYETLELTAMLDGPAVVLKQELADIPLWGAAARGYGAIIVNREASAQAMRSMMKAGKAAVAEGRSILIFPEGTRVEPGTTPPLKPGMAGLYRMLGLPVVPIAMDSGVVCSRSGPARPGIVTFRFGEPIPPGLPREEIEARVFAGINALELERGLTDRRALSKTDRP
jgi:1-acyl-sn-glycerol-3-phosphate acyltransferase